MEEEKVQRQILGETEFIRPSDAWKWPSIRTPGLQSTNTGIILSDSQGKNIGIDGSGVHTRNGDTIELKFRLLEKKKGFLCFGFSGGFEFVMARIDFSRERISLFTSEWTRSQPVKSAPFLKPNQIIHSLLIEKTEGCGNLIINANIGVYLNGEKILVAQDLNLLPEMGVTVKVKGTRLLIQRFIHRGKPSGIPEYFNVGGWQMPNSNSIGANLDSIFRGLRQAADEGMQLLVTPETSLTGLFPTDQVTIKSQPIAGAERKLRTFIRNLKNSPYLVLGLPIWQKINGDGQKKIRYNASRLYNPDGDIINTCPKIHSCEENFWHGYRYGEFNVCGVPISMHICHDSRYPDVWTVPIMFGARLILHPANSGQIKESIDAFEAKAKLSTITSHAFYLHVNAGGGSYLVGPQKRNNLISVSRDCQRSSLSFPMVGEMQEGLFHARIRIHDAFGYWPIRAYRSSEATAKAYLSLYESMGGFRV